VNATRAISPALAFDDFVAQLAVLNLKNVRYLVSYDGRLGNRSYGKPLPAKLHLTLLEIEAGRSSQATLLGRDQMTVESLYLSPALAEELEVVPTMHRHRRDEQMQLMEKPVPYGKAKTPKRMFMKAEGSNRLSTSRLGHPRKRFSMRDQAGGGRRWFGPKLAGIGLEDLARMARDCQG